MYGQLASAVPSTGTFRDVESTVRGLTQDFCTAFNTGNYDQVAALFSSDGSFMPSHHDSSQGPKAVERALRQLGESGYQDLRFETMRVDHSGDMAVETGRYTVALQANGVTLIDRGKYVRAWRRLGVWLLTADCWSSNLPMR